VRFVLDGIRSRHNVGSIFRTADAFRLDGLDLCGFTPLPPHREIDKTALGATTSVPWKSHASAEEAVILLRREGWRVLAVEQTLEAVELGRIRRAAGERIALVLGNELSGVSDAVIAACDGAVIIPQQGIKHSLNVAVCAGVVAWHFAGPDGPVSKGLEQP
jgi:tRNA G18 (ribose-2'-O)-methylase SpoU